MSNWTPVTERMPEDFEDVLVCCKDGDMDIAYHRSDYKLWIYVTSDDRVSDATDRNWNIVAWQPLPEPYKEESWQQ